MKNVQLSSRTTDQSVLLVLFCLGLAALVGCLLPTPFEGSQARCFDAGLSVALAVFVWSAFHLIEPRRYSPKWMIAEFTVIPALWLLIILAFAIWFYHLEQARDAFPAFSGMNVLAP